MKSERMSRFEHSKCEKKVGKSGKNVKNADGYFANCEKSAIIVVITSVP